MHIFNLHDVTVGKHSQYHKVMWSVCVENCVNSLLRWFDVSVPRER